MHRGATQPKFIDEWVMCMVNVSPATAKCGTGTGTLKQDVLYTRSWCRRSGKQTLCQSMILFNEWITWFEITAGQQFLCSVIRFPKVEVSSLYLRTSHLAGDSIVLGMFTCSLRAQNWQVWCDAIDGRTRDTGQHICVQLHLIFTVVLISRPIGPWKIIAYVYCFSSIPTDVVFS